MLRLDVLPSDGFDSFEWEAYRRSLKGNISPVDDASAKANAVLDAYARGEGPPGPAFQ